VTQEEAGHKDPHEDQPLKSPSSVSAPRGHLIGRRPAWAIAAALLILLSGVGIWQALSTSEDSNSNVLVNATHRPAARFALPDITNPSHVVSLSRLKGTPVILNFWASWCFPCRTEIPLLEKSSRTWRGRIDFVGIDTNDTEGPALAFLRKLQVTYPSAFDPNGTLAQTYGLFGLPVTVFISANGDVQGRHIGELYTKTLRAALTEAFPHVHPG
jgi:cytochrome c biogenesis protein CcmG/thiol:disulfide interchange protein DsbE